MYYTHTIKKQNNKALKHNNTVLSNDNDKLKKENTELKGFKVQCIKLLRNLGMHLNEIPTLEQVTASIKNLGSKLFSAFIMNNDHDLEFVQNKIIDGQEFKLQQIKKKQQRELEKQKKAQIEKQLDKALGFGNSKTQEHDHGGRII